MKLCHQLILRTVPEDTHAVVSYDLAGFDSTVLWECQQCSPALSPEIRLFVRPGNPVDYLGNPLSWPICSDRFVDLLSMRASKDYQILDPPLFDLISQEPIR